MLLVTKGYGFSIEDIDYSSPADLEPYRRAYELETENQDFLMHKWWRDYGLTAVSMAVESCLNGKTKIKYPEEPILKQYLMESNETEEERADREIREMIRAEEKWIIKGKEKGLPETII